MGQITESGLLQYGFKCEKGAHVTRFTIANFCVVLIHEYNSFRLWPNFEPIENEKHLKSLFKKKVSKSLERKNPLTEDDLRKVTPEIFDSFGFKRQKLWSGIEQKYVGYAFSKIDSNEFKFEVHFYEEEEVFRPVDNYGKTMSTIADLKEVYFQETGENL